MSNNSEITSCNRDDEEIRFIQAIHNDNYSLVELFLKNGVNVNCIDHETNKHQYSTLIIATQKIIQMGDTIPFDSRNFFDLIVKHPSCNVNYQDADGNTALHYSCNAGNWWTILHLIEQGADVHCRASDDKTPLQKLCCYLEKEGIINDEWKNRLICLLECLNVNDRELDGKT